MTSVRCGIALGFGLMIARVTGLFVFRRGGAEVYLRRGKERERKKLLVVL